MLLLLLLGFGLRNRLLLSLYAMGTNTGLKRVSTGKHGEVYQDLLYVRRRYITAASLLRSLRCMK